MEERDVLVDEAGKVAVLYLSDQSSSVLFSGDKRNRLTSCSKPYLMPGAFLPHATGG
jgi:hypothetical protein